MNDKKNLVSLDHFNELIKMRDGWMVYNKNDKFIGRSIKEYGEWSQGEIDLFKQFLNPKDIVIEVGANIGSHSLALSKMVKEGLLFAFEPQNVVFQNLCANLSLNSITNCYCYQSALSENENEKLHLPIVDYSIPYNFGAIALTNTKINSLSRVKVDRLDNIFSSFNNVKLIKIDVEGMELKVLKGGNKLIKRTRPILYLENEILENSKDLIEYIFSLDYRLFWHILPLYNDDNFFNNKKNIFEKLFSYNIIGIRKEININTELPEIKDSSFHPLKK